MILGRPGLRRAVGLPLLHRWPGRQRLPGPRIPVVDQDGHSGAPGGALRVPTVSGRPEDSLAEVRPAVVAALSG